MALTGNNVT